MRYYVPLLVAGDRIWRNRLVTVDSEGSVDGHMPFVEETEATIALNEVAVVTPDGKLEIARRNPGESLADCASRISCNFR